MARENRAKRDAKRFGTGNTLADAIHCGDTKWRCMPYWGREEEEEAAQYIKRLKVAIPNSKVVVADNVGEYYYATNTKSTWDINEDINCAAPPFDNMFIEIGRPTKVSCGNKVRE